MEVAYQQQHLVMGVVISTLPVRKIKTNYKNVNYILTTIKKNVLLFLNKIFIFVPKAT